ncbi:MAG: argininosuccinate lyase [candidate division FCPU426 bacterium]
MKKKTPKKLWGGTFAKPTHPLVEAFSVSTHYEDRLVPYDIQGSLAHASMLGKVGVVSRAESSKIQAGLKRILGEWKAGKFRLKPELEDVHGNVEARLGELIGAAAGKLHSGRSRNDQIALDERLYLRDAVGVLAKGLEAAQSAFLDMAVRAPEAIMPGYTHLQRAQPILFSHWCLAYVEMLKRDRRRMDRVLEELDECPLGAAALAGSALPLDRFAVAKSLGFSAPTENSLDSVSNRDYLIELAAALSLLMAHLSRLGEEVVLYTSQEFGFLRLDDSFATGSSLMPQKKNPDVAELMRGRAGRAFGLLMQLLTLVKGQPLAYNRDMQEDKEQLFQVLDMVGACLGIMPAFLAALEPDPTRMLSACEDGFLEATDAADYLVRQGVPFRQAHEAVGAAVRSCRKSGLRLSALSLAQWQGFHPAFGPDLAKALDFKALVAARSTYGGTSPKVVQAALKRARLRLKGKGGRP